MRMTMTARVADGYEAFVKARVREQREAVKRVTLGGADRVLNRVLADVNRLTGFMADQTSVKLTRGGTNFEVGWYAEDFIGQTNPVTGETITSFYPEFVIRGTRFMAGNDVLTAALRAERRALNAGYKRALENPRSIPQPAVSFDY